MINHWPDIELSYSRVASGKADFLLTLTNNDKTEPARWFCWKSLATELEDLSLISGTHIAE